MGSTATSHCWRGRSTSISANLPHAESSEDMFDFVFGDQKYLSNISSRESMDVVSRVPCKEVCEVRIGDVVCNPEFSQPHSPYSTTSVSSSLPYAESLEPEINNVVRNPQNDISIFATPLPEFVLEQRQRKLSRESGGSTASGLLTEPQRSTCTIIEEGREWYGYRDEGIRQAAEMFGVTGPWIRPGSDVEDVDADGIMGTGEGGKRGGKKEKPFWHGNGRKVGVQERWMCVGDDEFGIGEELVVVDESREGSEECEESDDSLDGDDGTQGKGEGGGQRKWWRVRWKNVFMMLGCGVLA